MADAPKCQSTGCEKYGNVRYGDGDWLCWDHSPSSAYFDTYHWTLEWI